jgi:beta-lactamase regulating signal transducer with metallopeptidase domain
MNALIYLLQVNLYLLLFYFFYFVILRNETFFKMNRFYLVGSALFSLIIPAMKAEWVKDLFITEKVQEFTQSVTHTVITPGIERLNVATVSPDQPWLTTTEWLWLIYIMVSLVFLINFLRKLYKVNRAFKMKLKGRAFSFFGRIVVDEELEGKETIVKHELVHARQWHSADVIFFEIFLAINWFNPIAYLYRNAIKNIHEFIADDSAASTLEDRSAYALLLVSNVFNTQPQKLTNNFFNQSLLKRRIIMLHKTKSRKVAILKYGLSVPLFAGMLIFSSATGADEKTLAQVKETISPLVEKFDMKQAASPERHPLTQKAKPAIKATTKPEHIAGDEKQPVATPINLLTYVNNLYERVSMTKVAKEGNIYVSFKVGKNKRAANFKIMKSIDSKWEKDLITGLEAFTDTLDLPQGKYHFVLGLAFGGNEDLLQISKDEPTPLFKKWRVEGPAVGTATEVEDGVEVHNTYVSFLSFSNPIIIVDQKEVAYTPTKMGLKLSQSIFPRVSASSKAFKGDKAVEQYGEGARKGLIIIETKTEEQ